MTVGKDVSSLFPDVVNCMQTENLELKSIVTELQQMEADRYTSNKRHKVRFDRSKKQMYENLHEANERLHNAISRQSKAYRNLYRAWSEKFETNIKENDIKKFLMGRK